MAVGRNLPIAPGLLALMALLAGCSQAPPAQTAAPGSAQPVRVLEPIPEAVDDAPAEVRQEEVPSEVPSKVEAEEEVPAPVEAPVEALTERKSLNASAGPAPSAHPRDATVIEVPGPESKPRTLWEAAVVARERRQQSPPVRTSITDDNLHEFQDAELTFASPRPEAATDPDADAVEEGSGVGDGPARGETYWRSRLRDLRLRLREAVDELAELDERSAGLRRSFYAADDPYVRDAEIKPAWDRALDRMGEVRREILLLSNQLEDALEEGRQAGALPGWLREGIELEPEPEELPRHREGTHEPGEPRVMEIESPPPAGT